MKNLYSLFMIPLLFLLLNCSNRNITIEAHSNAQIEELVTIITGAEKTDLQTTESLFFFLSYLKQKNTKEKWISFSKELREKKENFESSVQKHYGQSLYELGFKMSLELQYSNIRPTGTDTLSVDFVKVWSKSILTQKEKASLTSQLKTYCTGIREILSADSTLLKKFEANLKLSYSNHQIPIILVTNVEDEERWGLNYNNALTTFNYYKTRDSTFQFQPTIYARFFGLISTSSFVHELTHAVVELIKIPPENITPTLPNKSLMYESIERIRQSGDIVIAEGLAEYISYKYNSLYTSGHFNPTLKTIQELSGNPANLHSYPAISSCYTGFTCSIQNKVLSLYQSHSYVDFLIQKYGLKNLLQLATAYELEIPYQRIYGKKPETLHSEWQTFTGFF